MTGPKHHHGREQAANLIAAYLLDADADLYNWADEAARTDAMAALYSLAKLAAVAVERAAELAGATVEMSLRDSCQRAFGEVPRMRLYGD